MSAGYLRGDDQSRNWQPTLLRSIWSIVFLELLVIIGLFITPSGRLVTNFFSQVNLCNKRRGRCVTFRNYKVTSGLERRRIDPSS
jgi:hypothetical protein